MKDAELTKEQAAELIKRLASDDAFRTLFEAKPAKALHVLGVPAETIVDLNAACLCAAPLASVSDFKNAAEMLDDADVTAAMTMSVPKSNLRI